MNKQHVKNNVIRADFKRSNSGLGQNLPDAERVFIEKLYLDNFAELCRSLRRLYGNGPPEPEDVAQQAFEKLVSMRSYAHIDNPRAFLYKVAMNFGLKSIGRVNRARDYIAQQLKRPQNGVEEIDPERIYEGKQKVMSLEAAMEKLSSKQKEVVIRSRFSGQSYAKIAAETGWSQADISRQLNAALKVLVDATEASE